MMNANFDPSRYSITVRRVALPEGEFYEASVKELPDVISYHTEAGAAYAEARDALVGLYEDAVEQGRPFPAPCAPPQTEHSGRVTLRMSKTLHAQIAQVAEMEDVSLNSLLNELVARRVATPEANPSLAASMAKWLLFPEATKLTSTPRRVTIQQFSRVRHAEYVVSSTSC